MVALVGATSVFAYWSRTQFGLAFRDLDRAHSLLASTVVAVRAPATPLPPEVEEGTSVVPVELSFAYPQTGETLYSGCGYTLSWEPKIALESIDLALVDAGTLKPAGPVASGLGVATLSDNGSSLSWVVGRVWPGEYFLKTSKINGVDFVTSSPVFSITESVGSCPDSHSL